MKFKHYKAQTKIGIALYNGYPGLFEKDHKKAIELLEDSAKHDEPDSLNYLGLMLEKGNHYPQDIEKSMAYFKKSHEKGNDYATLNIALNSKKNENVYKEFIHLSAKRGNEFAKMIDDNIEKTLRKTNNY